MGHSSRDTVSHSREGLGQAAPSGRSVHPGNFSTSRQAKKQNRQEVNLDYKISRPELSGRSHNPGRVFVALVRQTSFCSGLWLMQRFITGQSVGSK